MIDSIKKFIKNEYVLCISALCAVATMFIVPPSAQYIEYIDFRVLCLLFCLMTVVNGFKNIGTFGAMTYQLLRRIHNGHMLSFTLVMLPFFCSMFVTNDVALLVFVPFTIALLRQISAEKNIIPVIVLQTVAANLGSMATPVGNPQNLFIYSAYNLPPADFFSVTLPLTLVSFIALTVACLPALQKNLSFTELSEERISDKKKLIICFIAFIICLMTVFRVIPYPVATLMVILCFFFTDKKAILDTDFSLLATFVCFFILSENLSQIQVIRDFLGTLLGKSTMLTSVATSQIISNVPAATLLSGFTENWRELLAGVNIGGLGTPVASLASLITLKLYMKSESARLGRFLGLFTLANLIGLIILLAFKLIR